MSGFLVMTLLLTAAGAPGGDQSAQPSPVAAASQQGHLSAELHLEAKHLGEDCDGFSKIVGCGIGLVTEQPLHLAVGSLAPQNGFGIGGAFAEQLTPGNWRGSSDTDVVRAVGGAWRAGSYLTLARGPTSAGQLAGPGTTGSSSVGPAPTLAVYAQTEFLPSLFFSGEGPARGALSEWSLRETVIGTKTVVPLSIARALGLAVTGEMNERLVSLEGRATSTAPALDAVYTDATAVGLTSQPATLQFGEGLTASPSGWNNRIRLLYQLSYQQFVATSDSGFSFRRWRLDLDHTFALTHTVLGAATNPGNGPDDTISGQGGPPSTNRYGTVRVHALFINSPVGSNAAVPFYFQPTLGGADINGAWGLAAFPDYQFRGPALALIQESLEHSLAGPIGMIYELEQGSVASGARALAVHDLEQSYAIGFTLRAGNAPMATFSYAWSPETGHRWIFNMSTSLLGGGSRPSLY